MGEFDGLVKYRGLADERGERPDEVVIREKVREDDLRAQGWEVVRWIRSELDRPEMLAAKIRAAFARARARGFPPRTSSGR